MATTMTEIPIKDLALTTAPAGKQLLVRDASAGLQRIDYDQIAKNLVESYGSSSLAGKNQSIKAAIDSLNSGLTQCNTNISSLNNSLTKKIDGSELETIQSLRNTSLNSIQKSGFYRLNNNLSDTPSTVDYGQLLVIHGGGDTIAQLCFRYGRSAMYFRTGNVVNNILGQWNPWVEVVHS